VARAGLYPESVAEQLSPERLRRFFSPTDGGFRMTKPVRDLCIFTRHDLTRDPPFSHLDLIMCRNVLIYLGTNLQKRIISVLHYGLEPEGFLVLGSAESVGSRGDLFRLVDKRQSIYAKRGGSHPAAPTFLREHGAGPGSLVARRAGVIATADQAASHADRLLLDRFAPPAVVVDPRFDIVQTRGQTGHFLELPTGEANLNVLRMAREGLLHGLRAALHEARQGDKTVRKEGLRVRVEGDLREVTVEVVPVGSGAADGRHYLVLFEEPGAPGVAVAPPRPAVPPSPPQEGEEAALVDELRDELAGTRSYLQSMIQDLEAANEELQSANEEILSSNEELQSTNEELDTAKEELQSTNEELHTLNEELQGRNEELGRANSDLTNLLSSLQMAVVMVDNDLRIRRLTPAAERMLNILPTDVGRPVGHIKPNFDCPDLDQLIRAAIDEVSTVERQVRGPEDRWFQLRIRSYKDADHRIDGAVLTLFDIDQMKAHERDAKSARRLAEELLHGAQQPLAVLGSDLRLLSANRPFAQALAVPLEGAVGRRFEDLAPPGWDGGKVRELLGKRRRGPREIELPPDGGSSRRLAARRLQVEGDEVIFLLSIREG
jgi:two-component system CheB/CheR fusion protein